MPLCQASQVHFESLSPQDQVSMIVNGKICKKHPYLIIKSMVNPVKCLNISTWLSGLSYARLARCGDPPQSSQFFGRNWTLPGWVWSHRTLRFETQRKGKHNLNENHVNIDENDALTLITSQTNDSLINFDKYIWTTLY